MKRIFLSMFCLVIACAGLHDKVMETVEQDVEITFDDTAARYVLEDPARALQERDAIWDRFEGYRITRVWHEKSSYPITWEIWEKGLNSSLDDSTGLIRKSLALSEELRALEKREHEKIVQHLGSYLPLTGAFRAHVYLVAFTIPYAFCVQQNRIGIDLTAGEWYFDPEYLMNMVIHELYHVGYKLNSPDRAYINADPENNDQFIRMNYAYMLSEGMATYVAYKARDLFPSEYKHEDYRLLENGETLKDAISGVNQLLTNTQTETTETLLEQAWDIGVTGRAYYIAGAHVCKTIEEKYGVEYLSGLVAKGGRQMIREYNALVPDEMNIQLIDR